MSGEVPDVELLTAASAAGSAEMLTVEWVEVGLCVVAVHGHDPDASPSVVGLPCLVRITGSRPV